MMTDEERRLESLKLITSAEHHFNNLCFNIRALASTWLLATFAGIGWIVKDLPSTLEETGLFIDKVDLILALCLGSSIGIFILWILDVQIYQQMLNVWFENRKKFETDDALPTVRVGMKNLFKTGRATDLIMIFYMALIAAPLLLGAVIANSAAKTPKMWLAVFILLLISALIFKYSPKDKKWMEEKVEKE